MSCIACSMLFASSRTCASVRGAPASFRCGAELVGEKALEGGPCDAPVAAAPSPLSEDQAAADVDAEVSFTWAAPGRPVAAVPLPATAAAEAPAASDAVVEAAFGGAAAALAAGAEAPVFAMAAAPGALAFMEAGAPAFAFSAAFLASPTSVWPPSVVTSTLFGHLLRKVTVSVSPACCRLKGTFHKALNSASRSLIASGPLPSFCRFCRTRTIP
mmetsp:Transcript_23514/g.58541  ORF Transcript_23514/g.58541 Transcript_23514/m.58541 type:complete len:215 (-) Transcript_23514:136-780(-)